MSLAIFRIVLFVVLSTGAARADLLWLTDYATALKQAKEENKVVLMDFTGSDWCGWCMKLKSEVFNQPEFAPFASANLVLLEVDFPRRRTLPTAQRNANALLAERYGVRGYPTVLILHPSGRPISQINYEGGGASAFLEGLKQVPGVSWDFSGESRRHYSPTVAKPASDEPLWSGVVFPPKRYDELKLTGLSGSAKRRLAIVNNQTFGPGETARVKLQSGEVKVVCKEIREKSVLIQVEGAAEAKELFLNAN